MNDANPTSRFCTACGQELTPNARLCPACRTDQRTIYRRVKAVLSIFSAFSVVLGVITIAISLFPSAHRTLFPRQHVEVYTVDSSFVEKTETLEMTVVNRGNVDVFLSKVVFHPADSELYPLLPRGFVTNKWLKSGEAYIHVGKPTTAVNLRSYWARITPKALRKAVNWKGFKEKRYCYKLTPLDTDRGDTGKTPIKESIPIRTMVHYSVNKAEEQVVEEESARKFSGEIFESGHRTCQEWRKTASADSRNRIGD